jgi:hypothetical protein
MPVTSLGFFVQKANGSLRLVRDSSKVKHLVQRLTHPFPSAHDIIQAIPPTAKYFACLDTAGGY